MYYYAYHNYNSVKLNFTFQEKEEKELITLEVLSSFLYNFNLLYDFLALSTISDYKEYKFPPKFYYSNGRPIKEEHKLLVSRISRNSPLELDTIVNVAELAILMIDALQYIGETKFAKDKLEELKRYVFNTKKEEPINIKDLRSKDLNKILKRLEKSNLIKDISIKIEITLNP